ncbi:helix-turn-helix domain-containing protein [Paenarthrobacter sp. NPDC056912]|uniref:helix-turn-helix domain-containing protein n=1 Tax=Paenarthrobacter sp. NPDC056912 TaxID=3345965 RepID=UPI00367217B5
MGQLEPRQWASSVAARVGKNIQSARKLASMSAQDLSAACEAAGYPIPRSTIANIESGRKETVSLQEVLIIARILHIPPLALIYSPFDAATAIHVTPNDLELSVDAAEEFCFDGEGQESGLGSLLELTLSVRGLEKAAHYSLRSARATLAGVDDSKYSAGSSPRDLMEQAALEAERRSREAESYEGVAVQAVKRAYNKRLEMEKANIPVWEFPEDLREIYEQVRTEGDPKE